MKTIRHLTRSGKPGPVPRPEAFTLIELLVVVAIIGVLAGLLLPVLSAAKAKAQTILCLNNVKQLTLSWLLYQADGEDLLPNNHEDANGGQIGWRSASPSWVTGNAFSDTTVSNIQRGLLFRYTGSDQIYRCPSDRSTVLDAKKVPRTRHYSMNTYMNGTGTSTYEAEWIDATLIVRKVSAIQNPSPANSFVFTDNHPGTMAGGSFIVFQPGKWYWSHFPDVRHQNGANLSFADGHSQHWIWKEAATRQIAKVCPWDYKAVRPGDRDLSRLQECIPGTRPR